LQDAIKCVYAGRIQTNLFTTDSVSRQGKAVGNVCPSVRLFPLYLLNQLTFELGLLFEYGSRP